MITNSFQLMIYNFICIKLTAIDKYNRLKLEIETLKWLEWISFSIISFVELFTY